MQTGYIRLMATFRRARTAGASWFFTLATHDRQPLLTHPDAIHALREAMREVCDTRSFEIVACVIMPDHLHAVWTLPADDADYSTRWGCIKRHVGKKIGHLVSAPLRESMRRRGESGVWQRRFWEHRIRDEADLHRHVDYIHFNPVKHGHVGRVSEWPWSSFHQYVRRGVLPADWATEPDINAALTGPDK